MANRRIQSSHLSPYVSYATWERLLEGLKPTPPTQLDRSFYDGLGFSGTQIFTLKSTLHFFKLIDRDDVPNEELRQLIEATGQRRKEILSHIVREAYAPLLAEIDVQKATPGQLADYFERLHARGDIQRKCISFFLSIASDAGMELSPYFLKRAKPAVGRKKTAAKIKAKERAQEKLGHSLPVVSKSWEELLMEKFPNFDPTWPAEIKKAWFEGYKELHQLRHKNVQ